MSDILTYRLKVKNKTLLYHSFEGARVYSKRCWLKPWKKRWYVEISLFTFFSFDEGHEKIVTPPFESEEEAEAERQKFVAYFKREIK